MKSELIHLINLLEDPDPEICQSMTEKILSYGRDAIPELEKASFSAKSNEHYERITLLLSILDFERLERRINLWKESKEGILEGINLITEITEPNAPFGEISERIGEIKNKIWLELSDKLTAFEKIRVVNYFLFTVYGFKVKKKGPEHPLNLSLHKLLTDKIGNRDSIYLLYEIICRMLNLPVFGLRMTDLPFLVYLDIPYLIPSNFDPSKGKVLFYISPEDSGKPMKKDGIQYVMLINFPKLGEEMLMPASDKKFVRNYAKHLHEKCVIAKKRELADKLELIITSWKPAY